MIRLLMIFLFGLLALFSCGVNTNGKTDHQHKKNLIGSWVHSHEESSPENKVFRTSDYGFPPSRGRERMEIKEEGILKITPLSPNDRPVAYPGTWELKGDTLTLAYEKETVYYQVRETKSDMIILKSI